MINKTYDVFKTIIFLIISYCMRIIYLICMCFKIKDRIFLNSYDGKRIADNPKYISLELLRVRPNTEIIWLSVKKIDNPAKNVRYVKPHSLKAIYYQATSKIWVSVVRMPYYSIKRKGQTYIHTWHGGIGFKKVEKQCESVMSKRYIRIAKNDSVMIDYLVSTCKRDTTEVYIKNFWYNGCEILEIGAPRNDIFYNIDSKQKNEIKQKYNLGNKKIAVYAPTFRENKTLEPYKVDYERVLRTLCKRFGGEWIMVVRLHHKIEKKAKDFMSYNDHIINGTNIEDVQELLAVTDYLITDYSSIALDYLHTGRPTALFATDYDDYVRTRDFYLKPSDTPFPIAKNNDELESIIMNFDDAKYKRELDEFKKKYGVYTYGNASKQIADLICGKMNAQS